MSTPTTPKQRGKRSRAETPASTAKSPSTPKQSAKRSKSDAPPSATKSPTAQAAQTPPSQPRSRRGDQTSSPLPLAPSSPFTNSQQEQSNNSSELDATSPLNYGTPASTVAGSVAGTPHGATPLRSRQDVRSIKKMRQVNVGGSDPPPSDSNDVGPSSDVAAEPKMVIWGTDVVVSETQERFKRFLLTYIDELEGETDVNFDPTKPLYLQKLEEITITEEPFLNLDCTHLNAFLPDLHRQLICYPQEVIPTFDLAVNELFDEHFSETELLHQIQVRTFNVDKTVNMRSLNPEDIDQLITVSGMIIRTSELIPEMREAHFRCHVCHYSVSVEIERGEINEPAACANCSTQQSMSLVHNRSHFTDKQMVKMQESPDDMPAGQTQHTIIMYAYNDLVDGVQPGDRVTVTGIFRATPLRQNPRHRNVNAVYKTYVDVIHFQKKDKRKLHERDSDSQLAFSEERVKYLEGLSKMHDIYERLAKALAPSIYENMDIKKGILLQLFGGTAKDFTEAGRGKFRSDMNILLCGDPGTSKSQLLQYVHNLIPRGQYVSGKGSSAVGLTAYVTRDPETGQLVLQPGALVLSDNGICCIDEFDKMADGTKAVLHEVMEQQTLSIAKAGIICQLNARTAILAAANPVRSQWDASLTTVENIQLSHTLLSRFDLIFLILDPQDEAFDRRLATHLVSLYHMTEREVDEADVDMGTLKDYIAYAKNNIKPRLSEEASQGLIHAYVDMRKAGSSRGAVSAYPRQLESLIRIAEAHAKMRFAETVNIADVEEAKRLHREALKQSAMDPKTGMIDINILTTGVSISDRKRRIDASKALAELIKKSGKNQLPYMKLFEDFKDQAEAHVTRGLFDEALKILSDEDKINVTDDKKMIRVSS